ncbi:hypothetical protein ACFYZ8_33995 [Streptomyces sp. NPDC001668]|uniref:hypothetical protein n=1 Tax=Streptomyces sp. NPDC001668 TaxID=3364598 RepID=UPI00368070B5
MRTTMPHVRPQPDTDPANTTPSLPLLRTTSPTGFHSITVPAHGSAIDDIAAEDDGVGYEEEPEALAGRRRAHALIGEAA